MVGIRIFYILMISNFLLGMGGFIAGYFTHQENYCLKKYIYRLDEYHGNCLELGHELFLWLTFLFLSRFF